MAFRTNCPPFASGCAVRDGEAPVKHLGDGCLQLACLQLACRYPPSWPLLRQYLGPPPSAARCAGLPPQTRPSFSRLRGCGLTALLLLPPKALGPWLLLPKLTKGRSFRPSARGAASEGGLFTCRSFLLTGAGPAAAPGKRHLPAPPQPLCPLHLASSPARRRPRSSRTLERLGSQAARLSSSSTLKQPDSQTARLSNNSALHQLYSR